MAEKGTITVEYCFDVHVVMYRRFVLKVRDFRTDDVNKYSFDVHIHHLIFVRVPSIRVRCVVRARRVVYNNVVVVRSSRNFWRDITRNNIITIPRRKRVAATGGRG